MENQKEKKLTGIQWKLLNTQWNILLIVISVFVLGIMLLATVIQMIPELNDSFENLTNITIFSGKFFVIIFSLTTYVFIVLLVVSILYTLPFARYVKKQLEQLIDTATSFTRGKLSERAPIYEISELALLSSRFNAMATHYEKQVNSLQKLLNENSSLLQQAQQAASLDERRKLARDLHDAVSQQLFAISMTMAALPKLIERNQEQAKSGFYQVEKMVNSAQQELRALIMHLRPVDLEGRSFRQGLQVLLDELKTKNKHLTIECQLKHTATIQLGIEDQLFRVLQEAISNMLRHSKAKRFSVKSFEKEDRLFIHIEDDGVGFTVKQHDHAGYGLETMRERMIELGGGLTVISYPNKGTKIEMIVPLKY